MKHEPLFRLLKGQRQAAGGRAAQGALDGRRLEPASSTREIGCSEEDFWDKGSFYDHLTTIRAPGLSNLGIEGTATQFGVTALAAAGAGIAAHAALSAVKQARSTTRNDKLNETVEK